MEKFKKSHFWGVTAFISALIFLNLSPKISQAAKGDFQTFQVRGSDIYRVTGIGAVGTSSGGIFNDAGLQVVHEDVSSLSPSSSAFYFGSDAKIATGTLQGSANGNSSLSMKGATTYVEGDPSLFQPFQPRTVMLEVFGASGSAVIKGTDSFNRARQETIFFISTRAARGTVAWIGFSSVTINVDTVSVNQTSVTFNFGSGPGYGLPFRIDNATDVYKMLQGGIYISTLNATNVGVNTLESTINISSSAFNVKASLDIWAIVRKSIFSQPTPAFAVTVSTP